MVLALIITAVLLLIAVFLLSIILYDLSDLAKQMSYKNETGSNFDLTTQSRFVIVTDIQKKVNRLYGDLAKERSDRREKEKNVQTLFTNISHDLRTPLTSIKGYSSLLRKKYGDDEYLAIIEHRLNNLNDSLDELFIFAKLSDETFEYVKEEISLYQVICRILASYYYDFEEKKIVPSVVFEDENMVVDGNRDLLERMIHNLISNVLKYGIDHFTISEMNGVVCFNNACDKTHKIDITHIFDRFYREEHHQIDSNGLGLSIVQKIVDIHDWRIEASIDDSELCIMIDTNFRE